MVFILLEKQNIYAKESMNMYRLNSPIRAYIKCSEKVAKEFYYYCGDTSWIVIDQYEHYREIMQKYESEIEVIFFKSEKAKG